jgi:hypothetical protein
VMRKRCEPRAGSDRGGYSRITRPAIVVPSLERPTRSFSTSQACGSCRTYAKRQDRVSHRSLDGAGERAVHRLHKALLDIRHGGGRSPTRRTARAQSHAVGRDGVRRITVCFLFLGCGTSHNVGPD